MEFKADSGRLSNRAVANYSLGQGGRTYINDTAVTNASDYNCDFYHTILCLEDTVFATLTDESADGNVETGNLFTAGTVIYGVITSFKLTSGSVHAYKAVNTNLGGE